MPASFFFDRDLNRLPEKDRNYKIGIGVSVASGVAWNSDTNQYLVSHGPETPQTKQIVSIPPTLDQAVQVVNLEADGFDGRQSLAYMPDQHLIAASVRFQKELVFFDNLGNIVRQIDVSTFGSPDVLEYIPTTKQFAVKFRETPLIVDILDADGNLVRSIDLSSTSIETVAGIAFFQADPSTQEFLILGGPDSNVALVTDLFGNVKAEFNYRAKLGVITPSDVAAITSGSQKGAFSVVDVGSSEIVVFKLH